MVCGRADSSEWHVWYAWNAGVRYKVQCGYADSSEWHVWYAWNAGVRDSSEWNARSVKNARINAIFVTILETVYYIYSFVTCISK